MREHIRILGILNIIMGCLTACAGIVVLLIMGGVAGVITASAGDFDDRAIGAPIVAGIGIAVAIFLLIVSAPSIVGGWGLLKFKPWSRIVMIVLSIFHLFHIPLGTALGVYGLWVLFSDEARRILESGGQMYVPAAPYPTGTVPRSSPRILPQAFKAVLRPANVLHEERYRATSRGSVFPWKCSAGSGGRKQEPAGRRRGL